MRHQPSLDELLLLTHVRAQQIVHAVDKLSRNASHPNTHILTSLGPLAPHIKPSLEHPYNSRSMQASSLGPLVELRRSSLLADSTSDVRHRGAVSGKFVAMLSSTIIGQTDLFPHSYRTSPIPMQHGLSHRSVYGVHEDNSL